VDSCLIEYASCILHSLGEFTHIVMIHYIGVGVSGSSDNLTVH